MTRSRFAALLFAVALSTGCAGDSAHPGTTAAGDSTPQIHSVAPLQPGDTAFANPATQPRGGGQATGSAAGSIDRPAAGTPTSTGAPISTTTAPLGSTTTTAPTTATPFAGAVTESPTQTGQPSPHTTTPASSGIAARTRDKLFERPVPFSSGEKFVYDVKFGSVDVGDAVMEVVGIDQVRGRDAYHVRFTVKGGTFFYKVNDRYESWIDTTLLVSLRHHQQIDEGRYERERKYEISFERGVYQENEKPEQPTVAQPLDDGSFFFFLRAIPLEVGQTYTFDRYFKPDRNPVTVTVVRREKIKVPAGTFDAIVLHPTIKAKGVFGEGGQAEIWLADDSTRAMLQMKSKLKIGSLNLYLKKLTKGAPPAGL
jgi:hypothetical protein